MTEHRRQTRNGTQHPRPRRQAVATAATAAAVVCVALCSTVAGVRAFVNPSVGPTRHRQPAALAAATPFAVSVSAVGLPSPLAPVEPRRKRRSAARKNSPASSATATATATGPATPATTTGRHEKHAKPPQLPRLTPQEETELLRQAVETRRLNALEREMALKSPSKTVPLLSVRAEAAGYGQELHFYEQALLDGQRAREKLITHNMVLVRYVVAQIVGSHDRGSGSTAGQLNSLSRDDLVQEGAIGLARAVDRWNPAIGGRFSTYAVYWIRASVLRCIAERDDVVRIPGHVTQAIMQINKAAKTLGIDIDFSGSGSTISSPHWKQAEAAKRLAEKVGLTDSQLERALDARARRYTGGYVAFEDYMQQRSEPHTDASSVGLSAIDKEHVRQTLSQFLQPKEMEALSWRYGLLEADTPSATNGGSSDTLSHHDDESGTDFYNSNAIRAQDYLRQAELDLFGSIEDAPQRRKTTRVRPSAVSATPGAGTSPGSLPTRGKQGEAMSFAEVGKRMHVSAEYGRRLCHAALSKLRVAAQDGRLEPGFLW